MGIFSSKKKTSVDTAIMRVVEDESLPDTIKEAVISAIIADRNIPDQMVKSLTNSVAHQVEKMHRYGRESYTHGLPNASIATAIPPSATVRSVIEALEGRQVTIVTSRFAPLNNSHFARHVLTEDFGWHRASNEIKSLSSQVGAKVFLKDIVPIHSIDTLDNADPDALMPFGEPESAGATDDSPLNISLGRLKTYTMFLVDEESNVDGARIIYSYRKNGVTEEGQFTLSMAGEDLFSEYFQVHYRFTEGGVQQDRYWFYREGSGGYPTLDAIYNKGYSTPGTYFPWVFFRSRKKNMVEDTTTSLFRTSTKLLDYIGMDFEEVGKTIHDNPDIGDVEQAMLVMGVPANSKDQNELRYLFDYFRRLYFLTPGSQERRMGNTVTLRDRDFTQRLSYRGVTRRILSGNTGKVGTYSRVNRTTSIFQDYLRRVRDGNSGDGGVGYTTGIFQRRFDTKGVVYRKQLTRTTYEEIHVEGLKLRYDIWDGHGVDADVNDERLLVPIDKTITDTYATQLKERLFLRSMHFVFNSRVTQKVRWYQSGAFATILTIAAIAFAIYSFGTSTAFAAALAAGTATAMAWAVITAVVQSIVIQAGFQFVAEKLGGDVALILAAVAAIYGGAKIIKAGSLENAPWATELLSSANGLMDAAGAEYAKKIQGVMQELDSFNLMQEETFAELEEIRKSLETLSLIDPFEFVGAQPLVLFGESPDNFYQRTVHSGNIGARAIDTIENFTQIALRLPTPQDTLGGVEYV